MIQREVYKLDLSNPEDKAKWLELRHKDITSTEISGLYGCSPYCSARTLCEQKRLAEPPVFEPNERMQWGIALEPVIAKMVAKKLKLRIEPFNEYIRIPEYRLGSSFDYCYLNEFGNRQGILEIKNVDLRVFNNWQQDEKGKPLLPIHIQMQVEQQMVVSGLNEAIVGILVGGNKLVIIRMSLVAGVDVKCFTAADLFFDCVDGKLNIDDCFPPTVAERLAESPIPVKDKVKEVDDPLDLDKFKAFLDKRRELKQLEKEFEEVKADVSDLFGDAILLKAPFGTLRAVYTKPTNGRLIVEKDVGTLIGARKASRRITVVNEDTDDNVDL